MSGVAHALTIGEVGKPGWTTEQRNKIYISVCCYYQLTYVAQIYCPMTLNMEYCVRLRETHQELKQAITELIISFVGYDYEMSIMPRKFNPRSYFEFIMQI
jgi:hypothetical protein